MSILTTMSEITDEEYEAQSKIIHWVKKLCQFEKLYPVTEQAKAVIISLMEMKPCPIEELEFITDYTKVRKVNLFHFQNKKTGIDKFYKE